MVSSQTKNGFNCVSCGTHRGGPAAAVSFAKREPRPRALGGVSGTLMYGFGAIVGGLRYGNTWARERPARKAHRTRSWEASGAHCPRSLSRLAARWWLRSTKKMPRLGRASRGLWRRMIMTSLIQTACVWITAIPPCAFASGRQAMADAIRQIGVSEVTYYRWRQEFGGLKTEQVKRLKDLELENSRLRKAVSDLTLDKLILQEAARGNF